MSHLPRQELRPESPALGAEQFRVPIKHVRSLNVLDGTPEHPQENCHKKRGKLLSPQECKIALCTSSQLKMKPIAPSLALEIFRVPHHTEQVA